MLYPRQVAAQEGGLKGIGEPRFADSSRTLILGVHRQKGSVRHSGGAAAFRRPQAPCWQQADGQRATEDSLQYLA
jgi:hypothetical protein